MGTPPISGVPVLAGVEDEQQERSTALPAATLAGIRVCLSGRYRAALSETLGRLNAFGLIQKLRTVSTVSGSTSIGAIHSTFVRQGLLCAPSIRCCLLATCLGLVVGPVTALAQGEQLLRVTFIDVGQGDAIWIQGPAGDTGSANAIIDGGPDAGTGNRLVQYLKAARYGLAAGATIDCAFATHPHDDHFPGLSDLLAQYAVRKIVDAGFPKEGVKYSKFVADAKAEPGGQYLALRTQTPKTLACGDLTFEVLYADAAAHQSMGSASTRENNASTVLKLTHGSVSFLFMGDAEGKERTEEPNEAKYVEKKLLEEARDKLSATVLKVSHHGSETSSTLPFMRAVSPKVVVIMSGRRSFSGTFLPKPTVLERYRKLSPKPLIVRTDERDAAERRTTANDQDGDDVYMYTDGESLHVFRAVGPVGKRKWRQVGIVQTSGGPEE